MRSSPFLRVSPTLRGGLCRFNPEILNRQQAFEPAPTIEKCGFAAFQAINNRNDSLNMQAKLRRSFNG
ncbi:MAG: hypothetical protein N2B57_05810 [Planctomycetales bacterium]